MENDTTSFIEEISTEKDGWKIKVRVLRVWKQTYQMDMILMDEKGDRIQASVKKVLMDMFERQIEEGGTIILSKFGVGQMNDKFPIIKHQYKLIFYRSTSVRRCQQFEGPLYGFRFIVFDDVLSGNVELEDTVDIMGYVVSATDMDVFKRGGRESKRISFDLVDLKGKSVSCTLWDGYAQQFSTFFQNNSSDEPVIVIIQFGKIKEWKGEPNIQNAFFGSRVFINKDIEEVHNFRKSLILGNVGEGSSQLTCPLSIQTIYSCREEFLKRTQRKYVEEIFDITKETVCVVLGTIRSIEEEHGWFYIACRKCTKKVVPASKLVSLDDIDEGTAEDGDALYCPKCKTCVTDIVPRFKVRVRVQDSTGTASFVLFDKDVRRIVGRSAYDIREQQVKDDDEHVWPREVNQLVGKRFIFKIEVAPFNLISNYRVYTVIKLSDDDDIINVMKNDDGSPPDGSLVKAVESDKHESDGCPKDAISYTEDSELQQGMENNEATSPFGKRTLEVADNELLGQNSSTKIRVVKVKVEK